MSRFIASLVQPYTLLYLLLALAIVNLWRKRRETRRRLVLLSVVFGALTVLSTPVVGYWALRAFEGRYPPLKERPADVEAIVVLAGGVTVADDSGGTAEMEANTLHRCLHAARLYRQGEACPLLVSGGKVDPEEPGPAYAEVMRDFLLKLEVRPSDIIVEGTSRNTYENAVESCKLLEQRNIRKVVLVTDALHMSRAARCFRKQGVEVVPAPCHYKAGRLEGSLRDFLPRPASAEDCRDAAHEWVGSLWYRLRGKM